MGIKELPEEAKEVSVDEVLKGERVLIEYRSTQSRNVVQRTGEVREVSRLGPTTNNFVMKAENGTEYKVDRLAYVRSTGQGSRKLSNGRVSVYRLEGLDIDTWEDTISVGGMRIQREKDMVFDCPYCGELDTASVNGVNDDGSVEISCKACRDVRRVDGQPVTMALKVVR